MNKFILKAVSLALVSSVFAGCKDDSKSVSDMPNPTFSEINDNLATLDTASQANKQTIEKQGQLLVLAELAQKEHNSDISKEIAKINTSLAELKTELGKKDDSETRDKVRQELDNLKGLVEKMPKMEPDQLKEVQAALNQLSGITAQLKQDALPKQDVFDRIAKLEVAAAGLAEKTAGPFFCAAEESNDIAASTPASLIDKNPVPAVIPRLAKWQGGAERFSLTPNSRIVFEYSNGEFLKPVADKLAKDIAEITGITLKVSADIKIKDGDIALSLSPCNTSVAKRLGRDGYTLLIDKAVVLRGNPARESVNKASSVFYASRTVLQMLALGRQAAGAQGSIPKGFAIDYSRYAERSVMLDVGRKFADKEFLKNYIRFMGWYKLNRLHLGLSNNATKANADGTTNGAFRLKSDNATFKGLIPKDNQYYTRQDWNELEDVAAENGVEIVPEINSPGHSVPFAADRSDLAFADKYKMQMLDPTKPETLEYMKKVFAEFLPWFKSNTIHIGGDELFVKSDTNITTKHAISYLNELGGYLISQGKAVRLWGDGEYRPEQDKRFIVERWINWTDEANVSWKSHGYNWIESYGDWYIVPFGPEYFNPQGIRGDTLYAKWNNSLPNKIAEAPLGGQICVWNDYGIGSDAEPAKNYAWEKEVNDLLKDAIPAAGQVFWQGNAQDTAGEIIPYPVLRQSIAVLQYGPGVTMFSGSPIRDK